MELQNENLLYRDCTPGPISDYFTVMCLDDKLVAF